MNGDVAGGSGGPAPFLLKTYEMVDDPITDDIVSWAHTNKSFVVWNPTEFAARLLPTYFKHNNFSSFIRQLNTYGFHKTDPERWEFANEDFIQGQKHLLKNIHRRKPIHSHTNPPAATIVDSERSFLEQQIDMLVKDKSNLEAALWRFKQQQSGTLIQLEDLDRRLVDMEQRQLKMISFLQRASTNPKFMDNLVKMAAASSLDLSGYQKKRRLPPGVDPSLEAQESNYYVDDSCPSRNEPGYVLDEEFCDKLRLELCPLYKKDNLLAASAPSSVDDAGSSGTTRCPSLLPETVDLFDTETSICPKKSNPFPAVVDEGDVVFPCHLSLAPASSAAEFDRFEGQCLAPIDDGDADLNNRCEVNVSTENGVNILAGNNQDFTDAKAEAVLLSKTNDSFWEQFFTEKPVSGLGK